VEDREGRRLYSFWEKGSEAGIEKSHLSRKLGARKSRERIERCEFVESSILSGTTVFPRSS
jgi:hypothetical protein